MLGHSAAHFVHCALGAHQQPLPVCRSSGEQRYLLCFPSTTPTHPPPPPWPQLQWGPWALLILVPALLLTLNVFWFAKILRGALKLLLGSPKQKASGGGWGGVGDWLWLGGQPVACGMEWPASAVLWCSPPVSWRLSAACQVLLPLNATTANRRCRRTMLARPARPSSPPTHLPPTRRTEARPLINSHERIFNWSLHQQA